ncbi:hypothetical protein [Chitinophaga varians]|uniref:hypothetical protein n=1 Tax=Chitinophaga varians TaxID=2202339 RepID=UPI00165F1FF1|nr:hypothetical protein [Chitinophaga varians]MBC9913156.1 hypothetical protein [Chitinophaga varians]
MSYRYSFHEVRAEPAAPVGLGDHFTFGGPSIRRCYRGLDRTAYLPVKTEGNTLPGQVVEESHLYPPNFSRGCRIASTQYAGFGCAQRY